MYYIYNIYIYIYIHDRPAYICSVFIKRNRQKDKRVCAILIYKRVPSSRDSPTHLHYKDQSLARQTLRYKKFFVSYSLL